MDMEQELRQIVKWTYEYFRDNRAKKAIIGMSGGIDSAVTAAICRTALGSENIMGIMMPCDSAFQDAIDAEQVCRHLGILCLKYDLEDVFDEWWLGYREEIAAPCVKDTILPDINSMIPANAKARLRMLTLYATAGQAGGLVVGTTNKTEALLGYATKYGDGGVDIEPIMDFYKTEIFEMAAILQLPECVRTKAPTAGLWLGQTDEGELGMKYKAIDAYLKLRGRNVYSSAVELYTKEDETKIEALIKTNAHKDLGIPHYSRI